MMRLGRLGLLLVLGLLCAVDRARAEDDDAPVVWIVQHVVDKPLGEAVSLLATMGDIRVDVEPALRKRKVTAQLDHGLVGAIEELARAAHAHVWKLGAGHFAVRAKAPPPEREPSREDRLGPDAEDASGEEPVEEDPPWATAIAKALRETPYEGVFPKTPIDQLLRALAAQAGVPIHLDPRITRGKKKKALVVDFEDYLGGSSVDESLTLLCGSENLGRHIRWGVLFITPGEHFFGLPEDGFAKAPPEEIRDALAASRVSVKLKKATLAKAMTQLMAGTERTIAISKAAQKHARKLRITATFRDRRLDHALSILLVPEGLALDVVEKKITVVVRPSAAD